MVEQPQNKATPSKDRLEVASQKFKNNPLVDAMIILGIIGLVFPFLGWLFSTSNVVPTQDLEQIRKDLNSIQTTYQQVDKSIEKILSRNEDTGTIRVYNLTEAERELFRKLSQEQRSPMSVAFSFIFFLIQNSFFVLLGILLERKLIAPRQNLAKKIPEDAVHNKAAVMTNTSVVTIPPDPISATANNISPTPNPISAATNNISPTPSNIISAMPSAAIPSQDKLNSPEPDKAPPISEQ